MEDLKVTDRRQKEVSQPPVLRDDSPAAMMMAAMSRGMGSMDLEKLEKFMELQEKWEKTEAKKAYAKAMTSFKENPPNINKDRHVKYQTDKGVTEYNHASLANVCDKINIHLSAHGLHASWATTQNNGNITVTCTITHNDGHSESTSLTAAPDTTGRKNSIQAVGSTISYLERYTILALTGLATIEMDNDGQRDEVEYITDKQISTLRDYFNSLSVDETKFLAYLKAESVETIPAKQYNKAITALKEKEAKKER